MLISVNAKKEASVKKDPKEVQISNNVRELKHIIEMNTPDPDADLDPAKAKQYAKVVALAKKLLSVVQKGDFGRKYVEGQIAMWKTLSDIRGGLNRNDAHRLDYLRFHLRQLKDAATGKADANLNHTSQLLATAASKNVGVTRAAKTAKGKALQKSTESNPRAALLKKQLGAAMRTKEFAKQAAKIKKLLAQKETLQDKAWAAYVKAAAKGKK